MTIEGYEVVILGQDIDRMNTMRHSALLWSSIKHGQAECFCMLLVVTMTTLEGIRGWDFGYERVVHLGGGHKQGDCDIRCPIVIRNLVR